MDAAHQQHRPTNSEANIRKAAEALAEVVQMKQEFLRCHDLLAKNTYRLVELLCEAESRGYLLEDALTIVDAAHWLQMIDWQTKFLSMILNFTKDPSRKSLRPLIELFGRDRELSVPGHPHSAAAGNSSRLNPPSLEQSGTPKTISATPALHVSTPAHCAFQLACTFADQPVRTRAVTP